MRKILSLGRFVPWKRFDQTIDWLDTIHEEYDLKFTVAGSGEF